jgi:hypothetical protein
VAVVVGKSPFHRPGTQVLGASKQHSDTEQHESQITTGPAPQRKPNVREVQEVGETAGGRSTGLQRQQRHQQHDMTANRRRGEQEWGRREVRRGGERRTDDARRWR